MDGGREGPRRPGLLVAGAWLLALSAVAYASWQLALDGHPLRAYALAYGALAIGLAMLAAWWLRAPAAERPARLAVAVVIVVVTAGLDAVHRHRARDPAQAIRRRVSV